MRHARLSQPFYLLTKLCNNSYRPGSSLISNTVKRRLPSVAVLQLKPQRDLLSGNGTEFRRKGVKKLD
jgi:hypothetical protein